MRAVYLAFEVPCLPASISVGYDSLLSGHTFLTTCDVTDARSLDIPSRDVRLNVFVAIAVTMGMLKNRVPTRHIASSALEGTHLATRDVLST